MNKQDLLFTALATGIITFSATAIIYGAGADLNNWSRSNGVQEDIQLETTTSGALNLREMVESGGVDVED